MQIVIAAGGTGGHVFPAMCVANKLAKLGHNVRFIVDQRGKRYLQGLDSKIIVEQQKIINAHACSKYMWLIIQFFKNFIRFIINRPNIVVGFGGYPSLSPVFAAQCLLVTTIIHEQNANLGKANKFLSIFAKKILTGFLINTGRAMNTGSAINKLKYIHVGNPIRFDNFKRELNSNKNHEIITILIIGGSQGATILDLVVSKIISQLIQKYKLKIIHQGKQENIHKIQEIYNNTANITQSFFNNMQEVYNQADLVICRAGASTISELIYFQLPSIIIPYKNSVNGDQAANAKYLKLHQAAVVLNEDEIREKLYFTIEELINNQSKLSDIQRNIGKLALQNSTDNVVHEILN